MVQKERIERQMERLRPDQFRELRRDTPLAYLPLGILEWHGPHNPIGLDGVKAHAICRRAAELSGWVVFPTLYYGSPPATHFIEVDWYNAAFSEAYDLPEENYLSAKFSFGPRLEQWNLFSKILDQSLRQIARFGFEAIIVIAGHYPLNGQNLVTDSFEREFGIPIWFGHEGQAADPPDGDHAAQWETSVTWALDPPTVDPSAFPKKGEPNPPGVSGKPVADITAELAEANLKRALEGIVRITRSLLDRRQECQKKWRRERGRNEK